MNNAGITEERLLNAYAQSIRRYATAEKALIEATEPVPLDVVLNHFEAAKDYTKISGVFRASVERSEALHAIEDSRATGRV